MIEWSEQHKQIRTMVRRFIAAEIVPHLEELEHGDMPPYDLLRKMLKTFGVVDMARAQFARRIAREKARAENTPEPEERTKSPEEVGNELAMRMLPIIELCRYSPGMVTALGVSVGLTASAILARGTIAQKERWALPLLTMEKIGAWAITEPGSGSDAFGAMKSTAKRDGNGGYLLNGSKTFITNGPHADTIVFMCKLDDGRPPQDRAVVSFVLDKGMPGLAQSKRLRKMGLHSSPTGELSVADLRVGKEHLLGEREEQNSGRKDAKSTFTSERTGVAAMALGIVEECLRLSVDYARTRVQFGQPIGQFQLIQLKLAKMEVARMNIQNLVFRQIEMASQGKSMTLAEASACKLYCAQAAVETCLEAVQLFGGNGYMAEYRVEQLCRDAKVLQIYGGTDEIQVTHIARDLLAE
ncbi:MAG: acyl-CoA dehydrogenase family protein [Proteobacteria bacterium]|nr:acyl-CoA dehydrogenase family protein [Pseudomonadota bacterium]